MGTHIMVKWYFYTESAPDVILGRSYMSPLAIQHSYNNAVISMGLGNYFFLNQTSDQNSTVIVFVHFVMSLYTDPRHVESIKCYA